MSSQSTADLQQDVVPPAVSRWALPLAVLFRTAGAVCVVFTTCYAYHIGL